MKVLVTGASGFIGGHLCAHLVSRDHQVTAVVRREGSAPPDTTEVVVGDVGPATVWDGVLAGHDAVIHLAARVHVMRETSGDPLQEFRTVNVEGTRRLAQSASKQQVRRFVYLSSIKVNGEATHGTPFSARDAPAPVDAYGISKYEAEVAIANEVRNGNMGAVIVRTPLVYGPGVGGNFVRMMKLAASGLPLPLGSVRNRRSLASVWNLADLLERAGTDDKATGAVVLAADPSSPSTPELLRAMRRAMGKPARLVSFPVGLLEVLGKFSGQKPAIDRLVHSLEVQFGSDSNEWQWEPQISFEESIERTATWFLSQER